MRDEKHWSEAEARALTERILSFSRADEARVVLSSSETGNTRFAVNRITTSGNTRRRDATIESVFGSRSASMSVNQFSDEDLRRAVEESESMARLSPEDPERMPVLGPQSYPGVDAYFDSTAELDADARARAALTATEPCEERNLEGAGYLIHGAEAEAIATSEGLFAFHRSTEASYTLTVRTADGRGSGWTGVAEADWNRVDPSAVAEAAMEKAERSRGPEPVEPGRYTVVLEPTAVANLLLPMTGSLSARGVDEGRSYFSAPDGGTRVGEQVADPRVTIWSDPQDPAMPLRPFDGEGLPRRRTVWIEEGRLRNLAYDRYWAEAAGTEPTGSPSGIHMAGGEGSTEDLIRTVDRGILVTRFWYIRFVDSRSLLYTGLTRDGTFLIENGEVTRPVQNLRFNDGPMRMLNNLEAVGPSVRVNSGTGGLGTAVVVPSLLVRDFAFTSVSDAV